MDEIKITYQIDQIEATRFIGNEFLMWLWFKSDCFDSLLKVANLGEIEVIFDDHIRLEAYLTESESADLKGGSPAYSPEAMTALRQGKRIAKTKLRINKDGREWLFSIKGGPLEWSGVRTPVIEAKDPDEQFFERMYLIEELEEIIETLYQEFLKIRVSTQWEEVLLPAMQRWVNVDESVTVKDYPESLRYLEDETPKTTFVKQVTPTSSDDEDDDEDDDLEEDV